MESRLTEFDLIPDEKSFFLHVKYPDEQTPRYSINMSNHSCSCKGWAIRQNCKHVLEYDRRLALAADKIKELIKLE